jgi:hypothetical protein
VTIRGSYEFRAIPAGRYRLAATNPEVAGAVLGAGGVGLNAEFRQPAPGQPLPAAAGKGRAGTVATGDDQCRGGGADAFREVREKPTSRR